MPYNGRRRNYRKKPIKKTYKKRTAVSASVKRYVKRTIHSQIENKCEVFENSQAVTSYAVNPSLAVQSLIPYQNISHGTFQGSKIGNEIRTRKLMLRFVLLPMPYDVTNNPTPKPQNVILFIGKVKNAKPQFPVAADFAKLYQTGDTSAPPVSNLYDCISPLNTDYFTIYKKMMFKVGTNFYSGTGSDANRQFLTNNDYKLNVIKSINITKYCPKLLKFNDGTLQPTNDGLFLWSMSINADGTQSIANVTTRLQTTVEYTYEDA